MIASTGCTSWITKKKEDEFQKETRRVKELMQDPDRPRLIGEISSALGMIAKQYDAIGLVHNLPNTGGIVRPSPQRQLLLDDMKIKEVSNPEAVIDSPTTAMVKLKVFVNPCDEKNDVLDVQVETSDECLASDIREGYLLPTKLKELMVLEGRVRSSNDKAVASGDVVILPASFTKQSAIEPLKGVIVGGGKLIEAPKLGLQVDGQYRHVMVVRAFEKAINQRFFFQDGNKQRLVAEGKNDWHIMLETVPKYRWDPAHYVSVIMSLGYSESDAQVAERIVGGRRLLANRETARRAAAELEAIGNSDARDVLISGLSSSDKEIRFYSAYSLAYQDRPESISVLMDMARNEPAFRPLCLVGLTANEHASARAALEELLQEPEPEVRYGAFWAIRQRNARDLVVNGENIGGKFDFVQIPSATPLLAVSLQQKSELVLFGNSTNVAMSAPLSPTPLLQLAPVPGNLIKITKRRFNGEVASVVVSSDLVSILRGMGTLGLTYNDVVHTVDQLYETKQMSCPVVINPRPRAGRKYIRTDSDAATGNDPNLIKVDHASQETGSNKSAWWPLPSMTSLWPTKKASE